MKSSIKLLSIVVIAFFGCSLMAGSDHRHEHQNHNGNDGIRLAADIIHLVGVSLDFFNDDPVIVQQPVVIQQPVIIQKPVVVHKPVIVHQPVVKNHKMIKQPVKNHVIIKKVDNKQSRHQYKR